MSTKKHAFTAAALLLAIGAGCAEQGTGPASGAATRPDPGTDTDGADTGPRADSTADIGTRADSTADIGTRADSTVDTGATDDTAAPPDTADTGATADTAETTAGPDTASTLDTSTAPDTAGPPDATHIQPPWTGLEVSRGWGPCPPGMVCHEGWYVAPDGRVNTDKKGVKATVWMTAAELQALADRTSTKEFQDGMAKGFACGPPPTDVGISLTIFLSGVKHTQSVTGCVLSGPAGNPAELVYKLVTKY